MIKGHHQPQIPQQNQQEVSVQNYENSYAKNMKNSNKKYIQNVQMVKSLQNQYLFADETSQNKIKFDEVKYVRYPSRVLQYANINYENQEQIYDKENVSILSNKVSSLTSSRQKLNHLNTGQKVKSRGIHRRVNTQANNNDNTRFKTQCQNIRMGIKKSRRGDTIYEADDASQESLTFGPRMLQSPEKNMILSEKDMHIKNQILRQISDLRKSQGNLLTSRDFSSEASHITENISMCAIHPNKKAKYRVYSNDTNDELIYCSKCAVNLLQKGHKIQQLRQASLSRRISKSVNKVAESRMTDIRAIQQKMQEIVQKISENTRSHTSCQEIDFQILQVQRVYDHLSSLIQQMKQNDLERLNYIKEQKTNQRSQQQKRINYYINCIISVKQELTEQKNGLISAKQSLFNSAIKNYNQKIEHIYKDAMKIKMMVPKYEQSAHGVGTQVSIKAKLAKIVQELWSHIKCIETINDVRLIENRSSPNIDKETINVMPGRKKQEKQRSKSRKNHQNFVILQNDNGTPSFKKTDKRIIR